MKIEIRKWNRGTSAKPESVKGIVIISENSVESELIDVLGNKVGKDGLIVNVIGEVRLEDGYGQHYIRLEPKITKCTVCGSPTDIACSDCRIDFQTTIYVCNTSKCQDEHELKCSSCLRRQLENVQSKLGTLGLLS